MSNRIGEFLPGTDFVVMEEISSDNGRPIYRVRSESISRDFAAKFFPNDVGELEWKREVAALAQLNNPHIVKLFRTLDVEGYSVLLTEWVEGDSVGAVVAKEGPLPPREVVVIAQQLVQALNAVHHKQLVHRKVLPESVIIDHLPTGDIFARLANFGFTKRPEQQSNASGLFESAAYTAPEQIREEELDSATDVYQLGCLLFFMLTGQPPFTGSESTILNAHLYQTPPRASTFAPMIRRWQLDDLILKMLDKDPQNRPLLAEILEKLEDPGHSTAGETHPTAPDPSENSAAISCLGPDRSVITASGGHIVVKREGTSSHFDVGATEVTAVFAAEGAVYYGTSDGSVCKLALPHGAKKQIVRLARGQRVIDLAMMARELICVDSYGQVYRIEPSGNYQVIRSSSESGARVLRIAASERAETLAIARADRVVTIHAGRRCEQVATIELGFDVEELAVSPDGYVVAAMSDDETWLLSGLDGSILHRLRTRIAAALTFSGGTLIGLEYSSSGERRVTEIL